MIADFIGWQKGSFFQKEVPYFIYFLSSYTIIELEISEMYNRSVGLIYKLINEKFT